MNTTTNTLTTFQQRRALRQHPFFKDAATRDPRVLWMMLETGRYVQAALIDSNVPTLVAGLERDGNEAAAAIVRGQLNDELGRSGRGESHVTLYLAMFEALERWRTPTSAEIAEQAGRELVDDVNAVFSAPALYERLGVYFASEIAADDIIAYVCETMQPLALEARAKKWADVHAVVELEHLEDAVTLPDLVPDADALAAFWRGAEAMIAAFWRYFDRLGRLIFAGLPAAQDARAQVRR